MTKFKIVLSASVPGPHPPYHTYLAPIGEYTVKAVVGHHEHETAWNAWSGTVEGCKTPGNCKKGWLNTYKIWSPNFSTPFGTVIKAGSGRWETVAHAIAAAEAVTFEITRTSIVVFHIADTYGDNRGGLTLEISANP